MHAPPLADDFDARPCLAICGCHSGSHTLASTHVPKQTEPRLPMQGGRPRRHALKPYLDALHQDTERRPFAEQIIDQLIAENEERYRLYEEIRARQSEIGVDDRGTLEPGLQDVKGFFLARWIDFERAVRD